MFRTSFVYTSLFLLVLLSGCAWQKTDKCYLPMDKYRPMRDVFLDTGSMQRVEQLMDAQDWKECERRQMRYMLAKDLYLDEYVEDVSAPSPVTQ